MKTCFSVMPFGDEFEDIDQIVGEAAKECGLEYVRGDRRHQSGSILPQIRRDIRDATVVVADITRHNPNVFYELGIAHELRGPDRVVIITQSAKESPYDVHEFRQLVYRHNEAGLADLREKLPAFLQAAMETSADNEIWKVIRGKVPRTRLLVRDLERLVSQPPPGDISGITIRLVSGLGSLAISDLEPVDPDEGEEYKALLLAERNALRNALIRGAKLKAILNPPRRFAQRALPQRLKARYERLLGLLDGHSEITNDSQSALDDVAAMKQCEFTLTPIPMPNQFIIGDFVAYEGMKRGGGRGFEATHCETNPEALQELIVQFDRHFEESRQQLIRLNPPDGQLIRQIRAFFEECMTFSRRETGHVVRSQNHPPPERPPHA